MDTTPSPLVPEIHFSCVGNTIHISTDSWMYKHMVLSPARGWHWCIYILVIRWCQGMKFRIEYSGML